LGSVWAWSLSAPQLRALTTPHQRIFARFYVVIEAALTLFLLQYALFYVRERPGESAWLQAAGGVLVIGLASMTPARTAMQYARAGDARGLLIGLPLGVVWGALLGALVSVLLGGAFAVLTIGFSAMAGGSYVALEGAEFLYARRHAPDTVEASSRALAARLAATGAGLVIGMLIGANWQTPWTLLLGAGVGVTITFWGVTLFQTFTEIVRRGRAQEGAGTASEGGASDVARQDE
jgi:hypothetical protein